MKNLFSALMSLVLCLSMSFAHGEQLVVGAGKLPDGLSVRDFTAWLAPKHEDGFLKIIQVGQWRKNSYVILVCGVNDKNATDTAASYDEQCTNEFYNVYIGVITANGQNYTFYFRTDIPVSVREYTKGFDVIERDVTPDFRLDLAPYRMNENTMAVGLRSSVSIGYAGGGIGREELYLFASYGTQLLKVLTINALDYNMIAGDWNPDGSRNHDGFYNKSTLHVLKTKTNGFYDYLVKTTQDEFDGNQRVTNTYYVWSEEKRQYIPKSQ